MRKSSERSRILNSIGKGLVCLKGKESKKSEFSKFFFVPSLLLGREIFLSYQSGGEGNLLLFLRKELCLPLLHRVFE